MSEQTDTIEAVARAVRATCGLSNRESADIAQAAIAAHTKALIEGAGELERYDWEWDGLRPDADGDYVRYDQAAATIGALRTELAGAKEVIRDVLQMAEARISALNQMEERDNQAATIAALRAEIERAEEERVALVRAGIEAAAGAVEGEHLEDPATADDDAYDAALIHAAEAIRTLDAAAIAKGV